MLIYEPSSTGPTEDISDAGDQTSPPSPTSSSSFESIDFYGRVRSINSSPEIDQIVSRRGSYDSFLEQDLPPPSVVVVNPLFTPLSTSTQSMLMIPHDTDVEFPFEDLQGVTDRLSRLNSQLVDQATLEFTTAYPSFEKSDDIDIETSPFSISPHRLTSSIVSSSDTKFTPSSGDSNSTRTDEAISFYHTQPLENSRLTETQSGALKYDYDSLMPTLEILEQYGGIDKIPTKSKIVLGGERGGGAYQVVGGCAKTSLDSSSSIYSSLREDSETGIFAKTKEEWQAILSTVQVQLSDLKNSQQDDEHRKAWKCLQDGLKEMEDQGSTIVDVYATTKTTIQSELQDHHYLSNAVDPESWIETMSSLKSDTKALCEKHVEGDRAMYAERAEKTLRDMKSGIESAISQTDSMQSMIGAREALEDLTRIQKGQKARAPGYEWQI